MKFYRPCKTNFITQGYGLAGTNTSLIPMYQNLGYKYGHAGLDFGVLCKDNEVRHGGQCEEVFCNVVGTGDLTVSYIQKDEKAGYGIIALDEMWNKFYWWHFDVIDPLIFVGQKIRLGTRLGIAGNTGMSTGAHIHFEYHDPKESENNGMLGAVDPTPFYDNRFACDIVTQIGIIQKMIDILKTIVSLIK